MPVFESTDTLYACIGGLFEEMQSQPQTKELLNALDLTVKFTFTEPEATITMVSQNGEPSIHCGESDEKPEVELAMTGDIAHQFWLGEMNVITAITKQQIVPTGSLSKIMKLTPLIKAAIRLYPEHCQQFLPES
jgi:hypothetical protein